MTAFIVTMVLAVCVSVALIVGVDAALEWWDRRRYGDECTAYRRCPECEHREPPSWLDEQDGVR